MDFLVGTTALRYHNEKDTAVPPSPYVSVGAQVSSNNRQSPAGEFGLSAHQPGFTTFEGDEGPATSAEPSYGSL